ncbi:MAG: GNAT family N-acetyltransferase [Desulfomonilia bacterium]
MDRNIEIVQACPGDIETASSLMIDAAAWLKERGQELWFSEELAPERLKGAVDAGELHLVHMDGKPVGTAIFQLHDRIFWPDMPEGDAAYIHKLTMNREVAGRGLGIQVIAWARDRARQMGLTYLRLDTEASRWKLCDYYEHAGFARHSERQVGRHYVVRYEMRV